MKTLDKDNIAEKLKGVLSDEALTLLLGSEALQELLKKQNDLESEVTALEAKLKSLQKDKDTTLSTLNSTIVNLLRWEKREEKLSTRETVVTEHEAVLRQAIFERDFFKERGDEFKALQHATVRNTTFRNTLMTEKHTAVAGCEGYTQNGYDYTPSAGMVEKHPVIEKEEKSEE